MRLPALRRTPMALVLGLALFAATAQASTPAAVEALIKSRDASALAQAQALVEANEGNAVAWTLLARAQLQKGEADDAVDSAEQAVELAPDNAQAQLWLGNSLGVRIGQVNVLRKMAMAPDLRDAFEAAVRLDPNLFDARTALIQFYLQAPEAIGGGIDKAKAQVAEIAKRNPVRGHLAQISIDRFNKDEAAAARSMDAALAAVAAASSLEHEVRLGVGMGLQSFERWDEALAYFQRWANEQPRAATPRYQLGRIAAVSGKHLDLGAEALRAVLGGGFERHQNDPRDTAAWWRLGQIEAHRGAKDAARTAFNTALRLDPTNEEAKKSLQAL
ncbi:MAG: tetratricopeptide repeat protein [Silanimonas sp.]